MEDNVTKRSCGCPCGRNRFTVSGSPLLRVICHCRICQEFNHDPCADIAIYKRTQVDFADESGVQFRAYKQPELVQRGRCVACEKPVIEHMRLPLFPDLEIVPAAVHEQADSLPPAELHMFYHRRQADAEDALKKYSGFLASQAGFLRHLVRALRAARV